MIKSWQHRGLKRFFEKGSMAGIQPAHKTRLKIILQQLNAAVSADDMNLPGMKFHALKGEYNGFYSVSVNGNWRVVFGFEGLDAVLVDYLDYH